jgi:hypothetical protein
MRNENDVIVRNMVDAPAGPLDEERSELPPPPAPAQPTYQELIAIYSLIKAGFTAEDFS